MLISFETFNNRKIKLLDNLKSTRSLLRVLADCKRTFGTTKLEADNWQQTITATRQLFKREYDELLELARWRKKVGIGDDEEYRVFEQKAERTG